MAKYLIGEVEGLTGVKAHVLRYWEEVIPCFSPQKDISGRRLYSQREIDMIRRLQFLIQKQGYTIEGARRRLIQETATAEANMTSITALRQARAQMSELYLMLRKSGESHAKKQQEQNDGSKEQP